MTGLEGLDDDRFAYELMALSDAAYDESWRDVVWRL